MLISILGNALVLAAIIRTPSVRSTHMIMFGSRALFEIFLVGSSYLLKPSLTGVAFRENALLMNTVQEKYHQWVLIGCFAVYKTLTTTHLCCCQVLGVSLVLQLSFVLFAETKRTIF